MNIKIALELPEDEVHISLIRQIGRALLKHHQATDQDADDIEAVVGELCANVTRHARSQEGCYRVALEHQGSRIVVTVADHGQGFDPEHVPPAGTERPDSDGCTRQGGFGLPLVSAMADRVEFQPSQPCGTTVRVEKTLKASCAERRP